MLPTELLLRLNKNHLFITGGTGFFGKSFLDVIIAFKSLHQLDLNVTILTRNSSLFLKEHPQYQQSWIDFHEGDVQHFAFPQTHFNHILHFATPASLAHAKSNPQEMFDTIVNGTRRILDFAQQAKIKNVLFASSGAVYGKQPPHLSHVAEDYEVELTVDDSSYAKGKKAAELLGIYYQENYGINFKIARCFAFVGPHLDPDGNYAIGNLIRDAVEGKSLIIKGDGTSYRSYLYSDDLVYWLVKILIDGDSLSPYNVGSDEALSIHDLAKKILQVLNLKNQIEVRQTPIDGQPKDGYVPSISKAKQELGLEVFTSLDEAIQRTALSYQKLKKK